MTRMLKTLGLSFVAILALSAMAATTAQAHTFKPAKAPAVLTGTNEGNDAFIIGGNAVECEDSHFVATQEKEEAASLTVLPLYQNAKEEVGKCEFAGSAATVTVNHCAYVFSSNTEVTTTEPEQKHAHVNIECATENDAGEPVSNEITIAVPGAFVTLHVPAQEGTTHGVVYHNIEEEYEEGKTVKAVTVISTVKNITTKCTGFGCAILGGEHIFGEYNGKAKVTGYEDTGTNLKGKTAATTQENYSHGETPINIEVVGAPSTP